MCAYYSAQRLAARDCGSPQHAELPQAPTSSDAYLSEAGPVGIDTRAFALAQSQALEDCISQAEAGALSLLALAEGLQWRCQRMARVLHATVSTTIAAVGRAKVEVQGRQQCAVACASAVLKHGLALLDCRIQAGSAACACACARTTDDSVRSSCLRSFPQQLACSASHSGLALTSPVHGPVVCSGLAPLGDAHTLRACTAAAVSCSVAVGSVHGSGLRAFMCTRGQDLVLNTAVVVLVGREGCAAAWLEDEDVEVDVRASRPPHSRGEAAHTLALLKPGPGTGTRHWLDPAGVGNAARCSWHICGAGALALSYSMPLDVCECEVRVSVCGVDVSAGGWRVGRLADSAGSTSAFIPQLTHLHVSSVSTALMYGLPMPSPPQYSALTPAPVQTSETWVLLGLYDDVIMLNAFVLPGGALLVAAECECGPGLPSPRARIDSVCFGVDGRVFVADVGAHWLTPVLLLPQLCPVTQLCVFRCLQP